MTITYEDIEAFKEWQTSEEYYNQDFAMSTPTVMAMVKEFSEVTQQVPNQRTYLNLIDEEFSEWLEEAYTDRIENPEAELKELSDLVYVIYGYANVRGWDLDEAVRRVHANNIGRCVQPDGIILRREDGKILKNKNYPKVFLGDLV